MKRLHDWRSRLSATIESFTLTPFAWGEHDCAIFAARCVEAVVGVDYAARFYGKYDTKTGAMRVLADAGYSDIADLIIAMLGPDSEIHPSRARRGDLAIIESETGNTVGVFDHERIGAVALEGYATVERSRAIRAFKVGE